MSTIRPFPGFDHLHSLNERDWKAFRADIALGPLDPWAVSRGDVRPNRVTARWMMGKRVPEAFVFTGFYAVKLMSEPLVTALRDAGCTGWAVYDVALAGKHGEDVGPYFGLMITGRCGPIVFGTQGHIMKRMPGGDFPYLIGVGFDEASWDGSDIFMAADRGFLFVTERARDVILSFARSVAFTPLTEVEVPDRSQ